jgi:hypothetical protein
LLRFFKINFQDLHTINLDDFKFSKTKITSLRLVDSSNPELHSLLSDWSLLAAKRGMKNVITPQNLLVRNKLLIKLMNKFAVIKTRLIYHKIE